ncbi:MAG: hypothetical protein ACI89J_002192 [Hyphomicrobiaceae bacterium]|jgi:hypothetical protein
MVSSGVFYEARKRIGFDGRVVAPHTNIGLTSASWAGPTQAGMTA